MQFLQASAIDDATRAPPARPAEQVTRRPAKCHPTLRKRRGSRVGPQAHINDIISLHQPHQRSPAKEICMLKRRRIHAVFIVLLAFLGAAQPQQAAPAQPKPRRFLMWKATSPTATVYLVGSIHVGNSSMYPLPREVESVFVAAKVLAVEINIKNADQDRKSVV